MVGKCGECGLLQFAVFPKLLVGHFPRKFSRMERLKWLPERFQASHSPLTASRGCAARWVG